MIVLFDQFKFSCFNSGFQVLKELMDAPYLHHPVLFDLEHGPLGNVHVALHVRLQVEQFAGEHGVEAHQLLAQISALHLVHLVDALILDLLLLYA